LRVPQLAELHQRHRVHLDLRRHHELHSRQAHAIGWQRPPAQRGRGIREIEHHVRARFGHRIDIELRRFDFRLPVVDETLLALRARDRDVLPFSQYLRGVAGAHHRGKAELAAHDGRMRSAPTHGNQRGCAS
jgi:hypothetical protein